MRWAAIQAARQVSRRARVDVGGDVGERERDALVLDDRLPERLALGRVVARELERGAGDADRLSGDHRARALEGAERRRAAPLDGGGGAALLGRARPAAARPVRPRGPWRSALCESLLAAEQLIAGHAAVLEDDLAGVRGAAAELVELAQHRQPRRALGDDEHALPAVAGLGIDGRDDDVHVGDAAVADEDLLPVDDPVAAVLTRAGLDRADVAAAARLGHGQRGELYVVRACRSTRAPSAPAARRSRPGGSRRAPARA